MRNVLVPTVAAVALFTMGVFILSTQLWYSARADSLAGARYAVKNMDAILAEAHDATQKAAVIAEKGCGVEGQYQLGTETALQPHLRTLFIIKQGKVWCSSLSGNRILLVNVMAFPASQLLLVSAKNTVNGLPVLIYQTSSDEVRIMVTISDRHIRNILDTALRNVTYTLRMGDVVIGSSGDIATVSTDNHHHGHVNATNYPYSIEYSFPPVFSLQRLISQGGGILLFILLVACLAAYVMYKYLNKNTLPEESLRSAIARGEIVPFYQPVVNGREGTLRGVEVLARWKHPKAGYISPGSFIPIAEKSGLIVPLTQSLMAQVETQAQLDYLNRNNIVFQQGYYFFKPVPFTGLVHILLSKPKVKVVVE